MNTRWLFTLIATISAACVQAQLLEFTPDAINTIARHDPWPPPAPRDYLP